MANKNDDTPSMSFHNQFNGENQQINQGVVNNPTQNVQHNCSDDALAEFQKLLTPPLDQSDDANILNETVAFLRSRMQDSEAVQQEGDEVVSQDEDEVEVVDQEATTIYEKFKAMLERNLEKFGPALLKAAAAVLTAASATNPLLAGLVTLLTELANV